MKFVALLVGLWFGISSWLPSVAGAPIPAPKAKAKAVVMQKADLVGAWHALWGGCGVSMVFSPDGSYSHTMTGGVWVGAWKLQSGVLSVREAQALPGGGLGAWKSWRCKPRKTLHGWKAQLLGDYSVQWALTERMLGP
jgi:hypothetical protein